MAPTAEDFFKNLPIVTKYTVIFSLGLTVLASLQVLNPYSYLLFWDKIFDLKSLQLWRLITNFYYFGNFSFNFIFNFMFLYVHQVAI